MRLLSEAAYVLRTRLESSLQSSHRDRPLLAIGLVLASTVFLSCSDVTAKYLASSVPAIEIAWLRYLVFLLIVLPPVLRTGLKRTFRSQRPGLQVFRGLALVTSSILFISSLRYLPIAEATATSFAAPIFITALSVVVLGEKVGYRRWAATFAGLIGVLVVVRTGTSAFDPASILPLLAALSWASAVVVTRQTSAVDSALSTLAYSAVIGVLVLSALLPFFWMPPDCSTILFGTLIGCAATAGHSLIIVAFRYGDASVLAPFTYTQLVWVTGLGILLFGAIPDQWLSPPWPVAKFLPAIRNSNRRLRGRDLAASALVPTGCSPRAYQSAHSPSDRSENGSFWASVTSIRMAGVGAKPPFRVRARVDVSDHRIDGVGEALRCLAR